MHAVPGTGVRCFRLRHAAAALAALGAGVFFAATAPAAHDSDSRSRAVARPAMKFDPIPFGPERKRQTANYSKRHYGEREWRLRKRQVRSLVLHYTAGSSYAGAFNTFAANDPALGERPGVCAQFVVDKDGRIYQLTRLAVRCRHAVGLNHRSLGIEMVQEDLGSPSATANAILARHRQARSAVRLVAWLKRRYRVQMRDVIGHAMANDSRLFRDREGWLNDHSDWKPKQVRTFRKRVTRRLRPTRD